MRNKGDRNAFIESKSWNGAGGHKGFWKRYVSKARRRGARFMLRHL